MNIAERKQEIEERIEELEVHKKRINEINMTPFNEVDSTMRDELEYRKRCFDNDELNKLEIEKELLNSIEQDLIEKIGLLQSKANVVSEEKLWFFMSDFEQFKENLLGGNKDA